MTRSAAHPPTPHRLDVQGLRALAVVAVVVAHATDRPSGGFTGVDVFFVVSGFLITELIQANIQRDADKVATCRGLVEPLRDAWREDAAA